MTLYTSMPLELVLDGMSADAGPFVDVTIKGVTMRVLPTAPGIGRIERLLNAPLECYLRDEYAPGRTICYGEPSEHMAQTPNFAEEPWSAV